ncbi:MAG: hypothetical protein K0Q64_1214 [Nitrobacter vulgaris]|nr:hypothetical protein [Nitrobacter vulgaris]
MTESDSGGGRRSFGACRTGFGTKPKSALTRLNQTTGFEICIVRSLSVKSTTVAMGAASS